MIIPASLAVSIVVIYLVDRFKHRRGSRPHLATAFPPRRRPVPWRCATWAEYERQLALWRSNRERV